MSINQRLDAEVIELVASEFGFDVEFIDMEAQAEMEEDEDWRLTPSILNQERLLLQLWDMWIMVKHHYSTI